MKKHKYKRNNINNNSYANHDADTNWDYSFSYNASKNLTNIDVTFTPAFLASTSHLRILVHRYDPATKTIHAISTYNNLADGTGADRVVEETLVLALVIPLLK